MEFSSLILPILASSVITAVLVLGAMVLVLNAKLKGPTDISKNLSDNRDEIGRIITSNQLQVDNKFDLLRQTFELFSILFLISCQKHELISFQSHLIEVTRTHFQKQDWGTVTIHY